MHQTLIPVVSGIRSKIVRMRGKELGHGQGHGRWRGVGSN